MLKKPDKWVAPADWRKPERGLPQILNRYFRRNQLNYRAHQKKRFQPSILFDFEPDCSIQNLDNKKWIFVEVKCQRSTGSIWQLCLKYYHPKLFGALQGIAKHARPVRVCLTGEAIFNDRFQSIAKYFVPEEDLFFWVDWNDEQEVIQFFNQQIKGDLN